MFREELRLLSEILNNKTLEGKIAELERKSRNREGERITEASQLHMAVEENPRDANAHFILGLHYLEMGDLNRANQHIMNAGFYSQPGGINDYQILLYKGLIAIEGKKYREAPQLLLRAIEVAKRLGVYEDKPMEDLDHLAVIAALSLDNRTMEARFYARDNNVNSELSSQIINNPASFWKATG